MRNKTLRAALPKKASCCVTLVIERLRLHGLIRKIGSTHMYCDTEIGRPDVTAAFEVKRMVRIPEPVHTMATGAKSLKFRSTRVRLWPGREWVPPRSFHASPLQPR